MLIELVQTYKLFASKNSKKINKNTKKLKKKQKKFKKKKKKIKKTSKKLQKKIKKQSGDFIRVQCICYVNWVSSNCSMVERTNRRLQQWPSERSRHTWRRWDSPCGSSDRSWRPLGTLQRIYIFDVSVWNKTTIVWRIVQSIYLFLISRRMIQLCLQFYNFNLSLTEWNQKQTNCNVQK